MRVRILVIAPSMLFTSVDTVISVCIVLTCHCFSSIVRSVSCLHTLARIIWHIQWVYIYIYLHRSSFFVCLCWYLTRMHPVATPFFTTTGCPGKKIKTQRKLLVPRWTSLPLEKCDWYTPRRQERAAGNHVPGMDYGNMFRKNIRNCSRCQVPVQVYVVHGRCLEALDMFIAFLNSVQFELVEIFGDVGTNTHMLALLQAGSTAFDWESLATGPPRKQHLDSVVEVHRLLQPFLAKSLWPQHPGFSAVPRTWALKRKDLLHQYKLVASRVRARLSCEWLGWGKFMLTTCARWGPGPTRLPLLIPCPRSHSEDRLFMVWFKHLATFLCRIGNGAGCQNPFKLFKISTKENMDSRIIIWFPTRKGSVTCNYLPPTTSDPLGMSVLRIAPHCFLQLGQLETGFKQRVLHFCACNLHGPFTSLSTYPSNWLFWCTESPESCGSSNHAFQPRPNNNSGYHVHDSGENAREIGRYGW